MIIRIEGTQQQRRITLVQPDDFRGFAVELRGHDGPGLEDLQRLGRTDGSDHVWVDQAVLLDLAGTLATDRWRAQLAGMVEYAAAHGWVDDAGSIRAHVSRLPSDGAARD